MRCHGQSRDDSDALYSDLALMVCESRVPDPVAGKVQGPHCPLPLDKDDGHQCDSDNIMCEKARLFRQKAESLWARRLPLCIMVSLHPKDCPNLSCATKGTILEKWTVSIESSRNLDTKFLPSKFLLQAVRSYLHFCQLSAWLSEAKGKVPVNIQYRTMLCGEDCDEDLGPSDLSRMEQHHFPLCLADRSLALKLVLQALPRRKTPPELSCSCPGTRWQSASGEWVSSSPSSAADIPSMANPLFPDPSPSLGSAHAQCSEPATTGSSAANPVFYIENEEEEAGPSTSLRKRPSQKILFSQENVFLNERPSCSNLDSQEMLWPQEEFPEQSETAGFRRKSESVGEEEQTPSSSQSKVAAGRSDLTRCLIAGAHPGFRFSRKSGLPLHSSPAPLKRNQHSFDYDGALNSISGIRNALCYDHDSGSSDSESGMSLCKSAPASTNLLGNFEESALNGRLKPFGSVDGFRLDLAASGAFCPPHVSLPVTTFFFNISDDNAPSPYLGICGLEPLGKKGYLVPRKGTVQATLFNPQETVVKMFVVRYDLAEMPCSAQTFVRQRTFLMPATARLEEARQNRAWLRYLIHLRFATSRSGKLYLHTNVRMLFSRKSELDSNDSADDSDGFQLRSFTEMPQNPKFSPRKSTRPELRDRADS